MSATTIAASNVAAEKAWYHLTRIKNTNQKMEHKKATQSRQ